MARELEDIFGALQPRGYARGYAIGDIGRYDQPSEFEQGVGRTVMSRALGAQTGFPPRLTDEQLRQQQEDADALDRYRWYQQLQNTMTHAP